VVSLAQEAAGLGVFEVAFGDTIGVADPLAVERLMADVRAAAPGTPLRLHFHNTRNTGIANAFAAWRAGAATLDASIGGLGGCPFAPRATGNIATEDLVYMLDRMGVRTGYDLAALIATTQWLAENCGLQPPAMVARAGGFPAPAAA
jgi:hydroxymethylglutaryl-CoA lyase